MREGSDTLTAYLLAMAHEAGWEVPEAARNRMLSALTGFVSGSVQRDSALPTADLAIRKVAALEALTRYNPQLDADLAGSFSIEPNLWPTSAVIDWLSIAKRWPSLDGREEQREAGRADRALAPELPGHDHGIFHRALGLPVVADDLAAT